MQLFCVVIAAYTTEITFPTTDSDEVASDICNYNPKGVASGPRVCHSLMGVAISSILVCMILMIFDVFIPCVDTKVMTGMHPQWSAPTTTQINDHHYIQTH